MGVMGWTVEEATDRREGPDNLHRALGLTENPNEADLVAIHVESEITPRTQEMVG
jgi:hypothetical protein